MTDTPSSKLEALISFLEQDPENVQLRLDCTHTAFTLGQYEEAQNLIEPLLNRDDLPRGGLNLAGLIALKRQDPEAAHAAFETLYNQETENLGKDDTINPGLAFNFALSLYLLGEPEKALDVLSVQIAEALPHAATLRIQLLHQDELHDEAHEESLHYMELHPENTDLISSASTLALDMDNPELARELAERAPDHTDSKITLATLAIDDGETDAAEQAFDDILLQRPNAPRAWMGKGMLQMLKDDPVGASESFDKGAEFFGAHLGSWIAAGWVHIIRGDLETGRQRFQTALELDDTYGETHGSLGVLDILEGDPLSARKKIRIAKRLDSDCFSAALGETLLLQSDGKASRATDVLTNAFKMELDPEGTTLSQVIAKIWM